MVEEALTHGLPFWRALVDGRAKPCEIRGPTRSKAGDDAASPMHMSFHDLLKVELCLKEVKVERGGRDKNVVLFIKGAQYGGASRDQLIHQ